MSKNIKWGLGIVAALVVVAGVVLYPRLIATAPDDSKVAKMTRFDNMWAPA